LAMGAAVWDGLGEGEGDGAGHRDVRAAGGGPPGAAPGEDVGPACDGLVDVGMGWSNAHPPASTAAVPRATAHRTGRWIMAGGEG